MREPIITSLAAGMARRPRLRRALGRALTFVAAGAMFFAVDRFVRATPGGQTRESLGFAGTAELKKCFCDENVRICGACRHF